MPQTLIVDRDTPIPMRDGAILRADVYRPADAGPLPVILQRTMYGKGFSQIPLALLAAERGYAVVMQDTRGRWASEGENYPFIHEKEDGYDTVQWCAAQPWSNGAVGMFGGSYVGYTQWAAAASQPPALKVIAPAISFTHPYEASYRGGAMNLGMGIVWSLMALAQMEILRRPASPQQKGLWWGQLISLADGLWAGDSFRQLPIQGMPMLGENGLAPNFVESIQHPQEDEMWQAITCPYDRIDVPALLYGGWYDAFISTTLKDYCALSAQAQTHHAAEARGRLKLVIGPWTHGSFESFHGEMDFGLQGSWMLALPDDVHLRWFDTWLKGLSTGMLDEPPIRIFVMGENKWRNEQEWPLARTRYTPYYLHSRGSANSLAGDGSLNLDPPTQEQPDHFLYDPRNPVPTRGGGTLGAQGAILPGAFDQRKIEERPDVLVFTTPVLEKEVEVTGPISMHLWAATGALDTDFTAKLVDVHPDGFAQIIQDGILRLSHQIQGTLQPGQPYTFTIDLAATSNLFKADHRLRLEISSSNFPRFDRNSNTGRAAASLADLEPARQTIFHDADHPSHIVLPVIPRD